MGNIAALVINMAVEFIDVGNNLFHSRVGFGYACALVYYPALDALNVGGYLVYCRGGLGHVAGKGIANIGQHSCLILDGSNHVFNFIQCRVKVTGKIAYLVFCMDIDVPRQIALGYILKNTGYRGDWL
ncbi:hypothetical protein R84B8_01229 [Treponema sp. R8-4-B8]